MYEVIGRFTSQTFALLRIVSGLLFAFHGSQKLLGWPPGKMPGTVPIMSLMGLAGIIELVCGLLIAVGLLTGIVAFIAAGEMAAAYFMAHFPSGFLPIQNQGELAVLYCFVFLYFSAYGGGIWSFDSVLRRRTSIGSTASTRV